MASTASGSPKDPRGEGAASQPTSSKTAQSSKPKDPRTSSQPNIGDQVREAVQGAIDSQEFQNLSSTVAAGLNQAAQGISQAMGAAASYATEAQRRQELAKVEQRFGSPAALSGTGTVMAITGGILTFDMALIAIVFLTLMLTESAGFYVAPFILSVVLLFFCITLLRNGIKRRKTAQQFKQYKRVIGTDEMVPIASLASATGTDTAHARTNVQAMLDRGLFKEGRLDDAQETLLVTDAAYQRYRAAKAKNRQARQQRMAQQNGWTVREVAAEDVRVETVEPKAKPRNPKPAAEPALSPEARALKEKGDAYLAQLRQADEDIEDEAVSAKIVQIETVVGKIIDRATENPQVIGDLQQLMNYYLPMTVKLLNAYADLDAQPVQGENIRNSKREIEKTLDTLNRAFENLLDDLFRDMSWDVSSDIAVLHTVLAQEGLLDDPFSASSPADTDSPDTLR